MNKTLPPALEDGTNDDGNSPEFRRWSAKEVEQLRKQSPAISPWRVVLWMLMASVLIGLAAWLLFDSNSALSAAYGSFTVALPAAVLARGMTSPLSRSGVAAGALAFMLWEMVKIGLSIGMLMLAPSLLPNVIWPALIVGLILTMKVYFLAAIWKPKLATLSKS